MYKVQPRCFKNPGHRLAGRRAESAGQHLGGRGESKERETIILTHKLKERSMEKHFECIK